MLRTPKAIADLPPSPGAAGATANSHEVARLWAAVSWLRTVSTLIQAKGEEAVNVFSFARDGDDFAKAADALGLNPEDLAILANRLVDALKEPSKKAAKKKAAD